MYAEICCDTSPVMLHTVEKYLSSLRSDFEGNFRVNKRHGKECKLFHLQKLYYQGAYEMGKKEGAGKIFYLGVK